VEVYATDGDDSLGGSDLDLCLLRLIKDRIQARTLSTALAAGAEGAEGPIDYDEQCSQASLRTKAEDIKKQLTYADSAPFSCILAEVRA
jgi:molecular chaperone DnaK (HSP70)